MERVFQVLALLLAGTAAYFLWIGNHDWAFITAVLGSVSYFLSVRFQVKARNLIRESAIEAEMDAAERAEAELDREENIEATGR